MTNVPTVSVYNFSDKSVSVEIPLPGVFSSPVRQDIVHFVHSNLSKNTRQARGVDPLAGMRHAAISWGPGRAVARVPRVTGSGSGRTGQAAFANMTRKGRMFAPLKTWRRWHRKVNVNQRRYAVASALAASSLLPLVLARGHRVSGLPCLPLVLDDNVQSVEKTKDVKTILQTFGLWEDVERCASSKTLRAGRGKTRNRRFEMKVGPLFVYNQLNCKVAKALRNIPGVSVAHVSRLDIRDLAPGSHVGRLVVWTQSAFEALNGLYGSSTQAATGKTGFSLQRSCLSNADVQRIINSNEVQSVVRDTRTPQRIHHKQKKNPFRNSQAMEAVNPFYSVKKGQLAKVAAKNRAFNQKRTGCSSRLSGQQKKARKAGRRASKKWINDVEGNFRAWDVKNDDHVHN